MKRAPVLKMMLLMIVLTMFGGCMETGAIRGQQRGTNPGMVDPGPSGLSRDSKAYMANDAP